jgi:hypothetical protein
MPSAVRPGYAGASEDQARQGLARSRRTVEREHLALSGIAIA